MKRAMTTAWAAAALAATPAGAGADDDSTTDAELVISVSAAGDALGEDVERRGELRTGRLRGRRPRHHAVTVPAGRCIVAIAHAEPSVSNLDVSLHRGRTALARDTTTERKARAHWCAGDETARVRVRIRAFRGQGRYAYAAFLMPEGETPPEPSGEGSAGSALERLEARVAEVARGYRPVTPVKRETAGEGDRLLREVPLAPGRCYRVVAVAEEGIDDLDLAVVGPGGGLLQEDTGEGAAPTLGVLRPLCPAEAGDHRLAMRAEKGGGAFAWRVLGSQPDGSSGGGAREQREQHHRVGGSGSGFVPSRIRERHREAGEGRRPVTDLRTGQLATGKKERFELQVEGGQCYVVLAAGVPSVRELELRILDDFGNEVARDSQSDAFPAARACPSVGGRWTIEVDMFNGYGRFGLQVFASP